MRFLFTLIILHIGFSLFAQNFADTTVLFTSPEVNFRYERPVLVNTLGDGAGPNFSIEHDGEVVFMNRQTDASYSVDTVKGNIFEVNAVEDFNNDGLLDIWGRSAINYGITADSFTNGVPLGFRPELEVFGYVNGDSLVDFFYCRAEVFGNDSVYYAQAEPGGTYEVSVIDDVNRVNTSTVGDVNQDGNLDFCFFSDYSTGNDGLVCHLGDGAGNFTREEYREGSIGDNFVVLSDLTGDGFPEAILSQRLFPGLVYVTNNAGTYTGSVATLVEDGENRYKAMRAGDIDADGDNDLVGVSQIGSELADEVVVFINDGSGNFAPREVAAMLNGNSVNGFPDNQGYNVLFLDYVNDDLLLDIIVNSDETSKTYALLNTNITGTRRFVTEFKQISSYPNPVNGSADLNLDFGQEVEMDIQTISVMDLAGRHLTVPYSADNRSLQVNNLPAGHYIIIAEDTDGIYYRTRFIKQ